MTLSEILPRAALTALAAAMLWRSLRMRPQQSRTLGQPRWLMWLWLPLLAGCTAAIWFLPHPAMLLLPLPPLLGTAAHLRSQIPFDADGFSLTGVFGSQRYAWGNVSAITAHEAHSWQLSQYRYKLHVGRRTRAIGGNERLRASFLSLADAGYRRAHRGQRLPGGWQQPVRRKPMPQWRASLLFALILLAALLALAVGYNYPVAPDAGRVFTADVLHVNDMSGKSIAMDFGGKESLYISQPMGQEDLLAGRFAQPFTVRAVGESIAEMTDADGTVFMTVRQFNAHRLERIVSSLPWILLVCFLLFAALAFLPDQRR